MNKVILIDAIGCLFDKDKKVNEELYESLEKLPNRKIVLTQLNKEEVKDLALKISYEIFTLENKVKKSDEKYYTELLKKYKLNPKDIVCFEHETENVNIAKKVGIHTERYTSLSNFEKDLENNLIISEIIEESSDINKSVDKKAILDKKPLKRKQLTSKNCGILHILSSYNNTHLHVTDITGSETIVKVTGGMVTKSDRLKPTPNVAMVASKNLIEGCKSAGIDFLYIKLRAKGGHNGPNNPGPGAQATIRTLTREGIKLSKIEDVTPIPHDGCRRKGGKRGRRI